MVVVVRISDRTIHVVKTKAKGQAEDDTYNRQRTEHSQSQSN